MKKNQNLKCVLGTQFRAPVLTPVTCEFCTITDFNFKVNKLDLIFNLVRFYFTLFYVISFYVILLYVMLFYFDCIKKKI